MITPLPPYPAALLKMQKTRVMVAADLHIGWEMALSERGIHVPTQTPKILEKLKSLISTYKPDKLLIIGDIKHTVATAEISEWQDIPELFSELKKQVKEICLIRGNHDGNLEPLLPEGIELFPATDLILGDVGFFHGHKWPLPTILKCGTLVMGHVHPIIAFRDPAGFRITRQVWVKVSCNTRQLAEILLLKHGVKIEKEPDEALWKHYKVKPKTSQLFIMPSFNEFLGGKPLNEKKAFRGSEAKSNVGPLLRSDVVDMANAEIYLLDGTFLGVLKQLEILG